ncbi:MAG: 50S ribosomal protein L9 [bacterium]
MRLILRKEVENLGEVGDIVEVADGYGINYLIPQGLALQATSGSVRATRHEQRLREAQIQSARREAEGRAGSFRGVELEFLVRAGEDGRLFGSVTNRDIEAALAEKGLEVNRRRILLEEPIRKLGEYDISIRLHPEVKADVRVSVLADESEPEPEADAAEAASADGDAPEAAAAQADEEGAAGDGDQAPEKAEAADSAEGAGADETAG